MHVPCLPPRLPASLPVCVPICRLEAAFLAAAEKLGGMREATPTPMWELLQPSYPQVSVRVRCICLSFSMLTTSR